MKKIYLFSLGLMASIGVWAYGTGDCKKYITSQSDVVSQLGAQGSTIETSNNHMTVLVRVAGGDTIVIDGYTFKNTNPEDVTSATKNWSVIGVERSSGNSQGVVILRNCNIYNTEGGAGVQSYSNANVILENCNIVTSRYRTAGLGGHASTCVQIQAGTVNVMSGTYKSAGAALLITTSGGTMNVFGGTFTTTNPSTPYAYSSSSVDNLYTGAVFCDKSGIMNIYGGEFYGDIFDRSENGAQVSIYGGKFNAKEIIGNSGVSASHVADFPAKTIIFDGWRYVDYPAEYVYARKSEGGYQTACFTHVPTWSNVTFYELKYRYYNLAVCDKVALTDMVAGRPYIYATEADTAKFMFNSSLNGAAAVTENGFIGEYDGVESPALNGYYKLNSTIFNLCDDKVSLSTNRAYLNAEAVSTVEVQEVAGVERIYIPIEGYSPAPTDCKTVNAAAAKAEKVILNGKVYIRRNNQLFSVLGNAAE